MPLSLPIILAKIYRHLREDLGTVQDNRAGHRAAHSAGVGMVQGGQVAGHLRGEGDRAGEWHAQSQVLQLHSLSLQT
jgi:hypothetical protein